MFGDATPAGATPMPVSPKRTVTGLVTVSPFFGEMMYSLASAGRAVRGGVLCLRGVGTDRHDEDRQGREAGDERSWDLLRSSTATILRDHLRR